MEHGAHLAQIHLIQYPILTQMAQDYLAIQGSSTPSEHVFSNAALTNSKQCNWLALDTFEALQILKSAYRNRHLSAPAEAEKHYETVMSAFGGEDHNMADSPASAFL
jgi:hypothetical protein